MLTFKDKDMGRVIKQENEFLFPPTLTLHPCPYIPWDLGQSKSRNVTRKRVKKLFAVIKAFNHRKDFTPERNPINVNTVRNHSETASLFESMKGLTLERSL